MTSLRVTRMHFGSPNACLDHFVNHILILKCKHSRDQASQKLSTYHDCRARRLLLRVERGGSGEAKCSPHHMGAKLKSR
ncbi:Uncharacterized protein TCM_037318 [Theobroma cacao]|uniref:Uncharacterized protein n=1 Tax=Theobroma cacao TaxID=3641 RepID=A0A061GK74_THECC|nr:Uncharacterized protein TCM_037318 [Theobroma cacao]